MSSTTEPSRRIKTHKKSKKGCGNCKLRKIKCDETKPTCKGCEVYGIFCNYDPRYPELLPLAQEAGGLEASSFDGDLRSVPPSLLPSAACLPFPFPFAFPETGQRVNEPFAYDTMPRPINTRRSSDGCWTCRLRRKKCDENHPVCGVCAGLHITCHYDQEKPLWMDAGAMQKEAASRLKRAIKGRPHRRAEHPTEIFGGSISDFEAPIGDHLRANPDIHNASRRPLEASALGLQHSADGNDDCDSMALGRSDTVLFMFYLENVLPFLFPFYRPSILEGDKNWILDMLMSRRVVRHAVLCQSFYFLSLTQGTANDNRIWEKVFSQTRDAFEVLRQALQIMSSSGIAEHPHCAVRTLASVVQIQRFEIAILSFSNWPAHLIAALALFKQLLESPSAVKKGSPRSNFDAVMDRLGPSSRTLPIQCILLPSAEQAAFLFSTALLILDDIIASTALQEQPRLYEYHRDLLGGFQAPINLEAVIGLKNSALLYIGEIAALDAWKQQCRTAGNLDVVDLVHRATAIKESVAQLMRLETNPATVPADNDYQTSETPSIQSSLITRVWAHAALIYLFIVVSGWQPANVDVRFHVAQIIKLLKQISPPELLRVMVWPFCIAGCLAEPLEEVQLRGIAQALQPRSLFSMVYKALEIMENVWRNRDTGGIANRDLAACFRNQGDLVLLV
ncbi:Pestheic acid cluster transcriptional regulator 3 [Lachnellula cervina]|uniref:Pestheic acid cluster transcriptional regulator 3 n=1 Tax=Lachnellula cervina TaxID=1316786 RepID=A0A7D8UNY3_9HELO|nr:Pestheic acid cluster transcriptional regulator 3 [Lachnellula cervina]